MLESKTSYDDRQLIKELEGGTFRECTAEEIELGLATEKYRNLLIKQSALIGKAIDEISDTCTHPVVYDETPEGPACGGYTSRCCIICGHIGLL